MKAKGRGEGDLYPKCPMLDLLMPWLNKNWLSDKVFYISKHSLPNTHKKVQTNNCNDKKVHSGSKILHVKKEPFFCISDIYITKMTAYTKASMDPNDKK